MEVREQRDQELHLGVIHWRHIPALLLLLMVVACDRDGAAVVHADTNYPWELPPGFPVPPYPDDNPPTLASARLGKALFFDHRLSRDGSISCASCHHPDRGFSDTVALSLGVDGRVGIRNAPSLVNIAYHAPFFRDGGVPTLEQQVIHPVHDEAEMDHNIHAAAERLRNEEPYRSLALEAYGRPLDGWVLTRALASYERTLIGGWSRWDRWMQGDATALSAAEVRGWDLFNSEALNCGACHVGHTLTDHAFHNVGQYDTYADEGRERISLDPEDNGKFKTPTLRNIALTAPYMHDGAMATLEEVVGHFAGGGRPHAAKSTAMRNFAMTAEERADLLAFLHALTDERPIDQVP